MANAFFPFPTSLDLNIWWSKNGRIWNSCHIGRKYRSCQRNKSKTNSRGIPKVNEKKKLTCSTPNAWFIGPPREVKKSLVHDSLRLSFWCERCAPFERFSPNASQTVPKSRSFRYEQTRILVEGYSTSAALRLLLWRVCSYNSATGFSFLSWEFSGASYFHF